MAFAQQRRRKEAEIADHLQDTPRARVGNRRVPDLPAAVVGMDVQRGRNKKKPAK